MVSINQQRAKIVSFAVDIFSYQGTSGYSIKIIWQKLTNLTQLTTQSKKSKA